MNNDLLAGKQSWPTMAEDAADKVVQGITSRDEVIRVFGTAAEAVFERMATEGAEALVAGADALEADASLIR